MDSNSPQLTTNPPEFPFNIQDFSLFVVNSHSFLFYLLHHPDIVLPICNDFCVALVFDPSTFRVSLLALDV